MNQSDPAREQLQTRLTELEQDAIARDREIHLLRETLERFQLAVELAGVSLWDWHIPTGVVTRPYIPKPREEFTPLILGLSHDAFLQAVLPEDRPEVQKAQERTLAEGTDLDIEFRVRAPAGNIVWRAGKGRLLRDAAGKPVLLYGIGTDITKRKQAEEALRRARDELEKQVEGRTAELRRAEEKYRGIFENSTEGIYQTTPDGRYLSANPALARIDGYDSPAELIGQVTDIEHQLYVDPTRRAEFVRLLETRGFVKDFDAQIRRKDGRVIWVSENARAVRDATGKVVYYEGTVQDITERKHLEEQLRQAVKMEAVGQLAGGIAHDFNNLLTGIIGYADLLLAGRTGDDPLYEGLEQIKRAGDRAAALTGQLLAFSRRQILTPRVLDLNAVVADMQKMLRRLMSLDIELVTNLRPALDKLSADPNQLEQVILNLAVNARDAMPQGGRLTIETANVEVDAAQAQADPALRPGPYVRLTVSDTGHGMDEHTKAHLFEPFFTTKAIGQGTGLGLATIYGIVKQSEGHIVVISAPGQGTTFHVYLPRLPQTMRRKPRTLPSFQLSTGSETILLVEDEEVVRNLAQAVLQANGYTVLTAADGAEALQLSERLAAPVHLLIADVVMPHISGRQLAEQLAKVRPAMKLLYLSGYTNDAVLRHGVREAGAAFLQKPFTPDILLQKVREVLDQ